MENWGLITGKTLHLLHDSESSGAAAMHTVVATVSHEAAHQWFGNLVSMAWWDECVLTTLVPTTNSS
jgi:aminopeptidase N